MACNHPLLDIDTDAEPVNATACVVAVAVAGVLFISTLLIGVLIPALSPAVVRLTSVVCTPAEISLGTGATPTAVTISSATLALAPPPRPGAGIESGYGITSPPSVPPTAPDIVVSGAFEPVSEGLLEELLSFG